MVMNVVGLYAYFDAVRQNGTAAIRRNHAISPSPAYWLGLMLSFSRGAWFHFAVSALLLIARASNDCASASSWLRS
jgi:hypothetical protein